MQFIANSFLCELFQSARQAPCENLMSPLVREPGIIKHEIRRPQSLCHHIALPPGMHRHHFAVEVDAYFTYGPVIDVDRIHVIWILEWLRSEQHDVRITYMPGESNGLYQVLLELGPVHGIKSVVDSEMQNQDLRPERRDVLMKRPHAVKRRFSLPRAVYDFMTTGGPGADQHVDIAFRYAPAGRNAAPPNENYHEKYPFVKK